MKKILILSLSILCTLSADYIRDNSKNIVIDTATLSMWQDDGNTTVTKADYQAALNYCNTLDFAGYQDWILPNINELFGLVDKTKSNPAIDPIFQNQSSSYYWSSTLSTSYISETQYWSINFSNGEMVPIAATFENAYVRCKRSYIK